MTYKDAIKVLLPESLITGSAPVCCPEADGKTLLQKTQHNQVTEQGNINQLAVQRKSCYSHSLLGLAVGPIDFIHSMFIHNDGKVFGFCKLKCSINLKQAQLASSGDKRWEDYESEASLGYIARVKGLLYKYPTVLKYDVLEYEETAQGSRFLSSSPVLFPGDLGHKSKMGRKKSLFPLKLLYDLLLDSNGFLGGGGEKYWFVIFVGLSGLPSGLRTWAVCLLAALAVWMPLSVICLIVELFCVIDKLQGKASCEPNEDQKIQCTEKMYFGQPGFEVKVN
ncbi:hypothetical protein STEG23_034052 [Scotinomys teguina]